MAGSIAAARRPAAALHPQAPDPYRVPRPAVISLSGGRTSAYMLRKIVDAYGGRLPSQISVVFANTGMEREENRTDPDGRAFESMKRFRLGETYAELKTAALADRDLFDEAETSSYEGADTGSFDCHCTD